MATISEDRRVRVTLNEQQTEKLVNEAKRLKLKGFSLFGISLMMGITEASVYTLLNLNTTNEKEN